MSLLAAQYVPVCLTCLNRAGKSSGWPYYYARINLHLIILCEYRITSRTHPFTNRFGTINLILLFMIQYDSSPRLTAYSICDGTLAEYSVVDSQAGSLNVSRCVHYEPNYVK